MFRINALTVTYALGISIAMVSTVTAQSASLNSIAVTNANVCPKCGQVHASSQTQVNRQAVTQASAVDAGMQSMAPVSSYSSSPSSSYASGGVASSPAPSGVQNVLATLNAQRARSGIRPLGFDPSLQAVAQQRASLMASRGIKGHPPGSFSPGRYEGVGWSSSYSPSGVSACFTNDSRMSVAGAAMATGRDGVYFCVVYR